VKVFGFPSVVKATSP
jgi:hypothetical protein